MFSKNSVLIKVFLILSIPIFELLFLRLFLHIGLGLRLGFPGFTDYELLFPAPLGFLAFIMALEQEERISLSFQPLYALLNLCFVALFLALNFLISLYDFPMSASFYVSWWSLLILVVASGFFIYLDPQAIFKNPGFWTIIPSLVMVFAVVIYFKWGGNLWGEGIKNLGWLLKSSLGLFGADSIGVHWGRRFIQLRHPILVVHVGQGCAGFDGVLFFLAAFSIFSTLKRKILSAHNWVLACILGIFWFIALNVFRIIFLFSLGIVSMKIWGSSLGHSLVMGYFHTHSGYILYAFGLYTYFSGLIFLSNDFKLNAPAARRPANTKPIIDQSLPSFGTSGIPEQSTPP